MRGQGEDALPHTHKIVPRPRKEAKKKEQQMKIDRENLARLETEYKGYLKGDKLEQFFDDV